MLLTCIANVTTMFGVSLSSVFRFRLDFLSGLSAFSPFVGVDVGALAGDFLSAPTERLDAIPSLAAEPLDDFPSSDGPLKTHLRFTLTL